MPPAAVRVHFDGQHIIFDESPHSLPTNVPLYVAAVSGANDDSFAKQRMSRAEAQSILDKFRLNVPAVPYTRDELYDRP